MENGHRVQGNITCGQLPPGADREGGATEHGKERIDDVRIKGGRRGEEDYIVGCHIQLGDHVKDVGDHTGLDALGVSLGSLLHLVLQSGFPHCLLVCHQFFLLLKNLLLSSLILYLVILGLRLHIVSSLLSPLLIGKDSW